ncbi:hypothetical protein CYMTET_17168 [Cymbomonas tetramitiformis]|uniref:AAA+ ATPase domain-containing protein n=1 Tax=Cymbomonas tetramitiformis TaxID=36881 RepID=A0AAE0GAN1_9CHLO|nr:hypothetical protein CYMTET_17168 [Cymbomonas tetramitiformis]
MEVIQNIFAAYDSADEANLAIQTLLTRVAEECELQANSEEKAREQVLSDCELFTGQVKLEDETRLGRAASLIGPEIDSAPSEPIVHIRSLFERLVAKMAEGLVEREEQVRLILLAMLSGEHLLMLGPPGTGKSEAGRRLSGIVDKASYFERLLTKFSTPEELFGPLSIRKLEEDKYERQVTGYLPSATIAFIDEIFKANSAILNSLLTIMNEKLFHNGNQPQKVNLMTVIGASNELPESSELDALFDRFLFRLHVTPVTRQGFQHMLRNVWQVGKGNPSVAAVGSEAVQAENVLSQKLIRAVQEAAREHVYLGPEVAALLQKVRIQLQEMKGDPVYVSDRRWRKLAGMLKVAALTDGRPFVLPEDLLLLEHCLWTKPEEAKPIAAIIWKVVNEAISSECFVRTETAALHRVARVGEVLADAKACEVIEALRVKKELIMQQVSLQLRASRSPASGAAEEHLWLRDSEHYAHIKSGKDAAGDSMQQLEALLQKVEKLRQAASNGVPIPSLEMKGAQSQSVDGEGFHEISIFGGDKKTCGYGCGKKKVPKGISTDPRAALLNNQASSWRPEDDKAWLMVVADPGTALHRLELQFPEADGDKKFFGWTLEAEIFWSESRDGKLKQEQDVIFGPVAPNARATLLALPPSCTAHRIKVRFKTLKAPALGCDSKLGSAGM